MGPNAELTRLLRRWTAAAEDANLSTQQVFTFRRAARSLAAHAEPVTNRQGAPRPTARRAHALPPPPRDRCRRRDHHRKTGARGCTEALRVKYIGEKLADMIHHHLRWHALTRDSHAPPVITHVADLVHVRNPTEPRAPPSNHPVRTLPHTPHTKRRPDPTAG